MLALVPQMTGTALSRNPGILTSEANPSSYVWAVGSGNMSLILPDLKPWPNLSPDSHGLVLETLEQQKSSSSISN